MVKEIKCYICESCEMMYQNHKKACECEEFCKKNNACNIELIKHSIQTKSEKGGQK